MRRVFSSLFTSVQNTAKRDLVSLTLRSSTFSTSSSDPTSQENLERRRKRSSVWSWNEWDTLEECIVGIPDNAVVPTMDPEVKACMSENLWEFLDKNGGKYWADVLPKEHWRLMNEEINEFARVMEGEGVKVVRPDSLDFGKMYNLPRFASHGLYAAMPRDSLLIIGDEIIESTMTWRSRYFEFEPFRKLVKGYYDNGAKWTVAPKPLMLDELLEKNYDFTGKNKLKRITTNAEICFDAADFFRCGRDVFGQRSQVTNSAAIDWLRRHLAPQGIRVHELNFYDSICMHVDATLVPVRPGLFLRNPNYPMVEQQMFTNCGWRFVDVPEPLLPQDTLYMSSNYLAMNTLMMDKDRVFVEKDELGTQALFKSLGVKCIPVALKHCFSIGGGFHCWTGDVKRRGTLESYFDWTPVAKEEYETKYGHLF